MGTFLGSYRLEKRSKSHGVSENSITIGISIQMSIPCCPSIRIHFVLLLKSAGKMTSCQNYLVSEAELRDSVALGDLLTSCNFFRSQT